jgi:NAD(P)-dependent dehydrogenase (short-subunit alcohol dehydrogenase family)
MLLKEGSLAGRTARVTGGGTGLGRSMALKFAIAAMRAARKQGG